MDSVTIRKRLALYEETYINETISLAKLHARLATIPPGHQHTESARVIRVMEKRLRATLRDVETMGAKLAIVEVEERYRAKLKAQARRKVRRAQERKQRAESIKTSKVFMDNWRKSMSAKQST